MTPEVMSPMEVAELESLVDRRLRGIAEAVPIIGAGEVTVVVGWPPHQPRLACKRLPPMRDAAVLQRYSQLVATYESALCARGVQVSASTPLITRTPRGDTVLYFVQRLHSAGEVLPALLRGAEPHDGVPPPIHAVLAAIDTVDHRVGIDAQLSNWVAAESQVLLIDTTTPFLRTPDGESLLPLEPLLAPYPTVTRPVIRRWAIPPLLARYHRPRDVAKDLLAKLHRERLQQWIEPIATVIGDRFGAPLHRSEIDAYYRADKRVWMAFDAFKRGRRWGMRVIRKDAPYPVLLADKAQR